MRLYIPEIKRAILDNALNSKRDDQAEWMRRFEKMTGTRFLWPEVD